MDGRVPVLRSQRGSGGLICLVVCCLFVVSFNNNKKLKTDGQLGCHKTQQREVITKIPVTGKLSPGENPNNNFTRTKVKN